ncbi:MAG: 4Fe-4S ferredoxin [Clostridia bacterium]|nr:4Fe-4S ferredoxin [Clostridia bacterium]
MENKSLVVSLKRCPQNHRCPVIKACPVDAISQSGYAAPKIDMNKCVKCGKCIKYCPTRAISFE